MDRRRFLAASLAAAGGFSTEAQSRARALSSLSPADFDVVLSGIDGAEGLAVAPDGTIAFSNNRAAAGLRDPGGLLTYIGEPVATGGMAYDRQGRIVAASVGALHHREGPLRRIEPERGTVETLVAELEGRRLVASNSPVVARDGRIYCSHSGWSVGNIGTTQAEGFIYLVEPDGAARIVARGLRGVNGLCLGPGDRKLYAALTAEGRIAAWDRAADGSLVPAGYFGPVLGKVAADQTAAQVRALPAAERWATGYCDGLVIDRAGRMYVTLPFANRIVTIDRRGRASTLIHDPAGSKIDFPTNLAWGGRDLRSLYAISRGSGTIVMARMPVPGLPGANWPLAPG